MPVNITDVDAFTDPVTAPADGDSANGASFQAGIQKLANRTFFLLNKIWVATPATVVRWIPGSEGACSDLAGNDDGWRPAVGYTYFGAAISVGSARAKCVYNIGKYVPNGATITQVRVRVDPGSAQATTGNRMSAQLDVNDYTGTLSSSSEITTDATGDAQWITISSLSIAVDKTSRSYDLAVLNCLTYAGDLIFGTEVTFTSSKKFND